MFGVWERKHLVHEIAEPGCVSMEVNLARFDLGTLRFHPNDLVAFRQYRNGSQDASRPVVKEILEP